MMFKSPFRNVVAQLHTTQTNPPTSGTGTPVAVPTLASLVRSLLVSVRRLPLTAKHAADASLTARVI